MKFHVLAIAPTPAHLYWRNSFIDYDAVIWLFIPDITRGWHFNGKVEHFILPPSGDPCFSW